MNLALDLGNTSARIYIYEGRQRVGKRVFGRFDAEVLAKLLKEFPQAKRSILSSVTAHDKEIEKLLKAHTDFIKLSYKTPVPIVNTYVSPETLGMDRLACVVGAAHLHPRRNVLVVDAGTCIKYDFINKKNEYLGGSISPGFQMRFDALHHFTDKLPQLEAESYPDIGDDTSTSMQSGVYLGIVYEMNGFINDYMENQDVEHVILTGGDAHHFADELNFPIFAEPDLAGIGLNEILSFNQERP